MPKKLAAINEADELSQNNSDVEESKEETAPEPKAVMDIAAVKNFCEERATGGNARLLCSEREQRQAVSRIEGFIIDRRLGRAARLMRADCALLPFVCRRSYVKMWHLKQTTELYRNQANRFAQII